MKISEHYWTISRDVAVPNIYIIEHMQIIYAKSEFTRESRSFFFFFWSVSIQGTRIFSAQRR